MKLLAFFKKFSCTFVGLLFSSALFIPAILNLSTPIPNQSELRIEKFLITRIQQQQPNLTIKNEDGNELYANFPFDLSQRSPRQYLLSPSDFGKFQNCIAIISYESFKFLFIKINRVWTISCEKGARITFDQTRDYFNSMNISSWSFFRICAAFFVVLFCYFFDSRRKS
ncbi:hypothetical protein [Variovorax paradoxus]|uniref:hypothetical protein n=1 Tax=Variovorax paradoxus TaxID=34073 RepID=UPI001C12C3ED|nr:hypothetical protein [Variovorax paradoxus]